MATGSETTTSSEGYDSFPGGTTITVPLYVGASGLTCTDDSLCLKKGFSGESTLTKISIVQGFPTDWYQFLTWNVGNTSLFQQTQRCYWTASTSVECTSGNEQIQEQTDWFTADQVPITGFYTDRGNPTPVFSYLSDCFLGSNTPALTSNLASQKSTTRSSLSIPGNTQYSVTTGRNIGTTKPPPAPPAGLSTGAKAGIGVGAALGGILLIALGAFGAIMLMRRHSRRRQGADGSLNDELGKPRHSDSGGDEAHVSAELEHTEQSKELATGKEAHELPGRSRAAELAAKTFQEHSTRHELPVDDT